VEFAIHGADVVAQLQAIVAQESFTNHKADVVSRMGNHE
jgi:hypothetical protein